MLSAGSTPDDRRVLASSVFLGAMRSGEAAALTGRDHDATRASLGTPVIEPATVRSRATETARTPGVGDLVDGVMLRAAVIGSPMYIPGRLRTPSSSPRTPIEPASWPASPSSPHRPHAAARRSSCRHRLTGRTPRPDDLRAVAARSVTQRPREPAAVHEDLERIGLRARRQHDARRTFTSIAR
jgi:hypothetical protein